MLESMLFDNINNASSKKFKSLKNNSKKEILTLQVVPPQNQVQET